MDLKTILDIISKKTKHIKMVSDKKGVHLYCSSNHNFKVKYKLPSVATTFFDLVVNVESLIEVISDNNYKIDSIYYGSRDYSDDIFTVNDSDVIIAPDNVDYPCYLPETIEEPVFITKLSYTDLKMVKPYISTGVSRRFVSVACYNQGDLVATDGKALALLKVEHISDYNDSVLIGIDTLSFLSSFKNTYEMSILKGGDNTIDHCVFKSPLLEVIQPILEDDYPPYKKVIPSEDYTIKTFLTNKDVIAMDKLFAPTFKKLESHKIIFTNDSIQCGADSKIKSYPIKYLENFEMTPDNNVSISFDYLKKAFSVFKEMEVQILSPNNALKLVNSNFLVLIMPMRTD